VFLIANGIFLLVLLLVLLLVSTNGKSKKRTKIKEDIEKIKEQVIDS
jgi:hypothetical protein